jgi:hypothetical protein
VSISRPQPRHGRATAIRAAPSAAQADYDSWGIESVGHNNTRLIKVKKMSCGNGTRLMNKYYDGFFHDLPQEGDVTHIKKFRCKLVSYFDPFGLAVVCRHTTKKKAVKAFHPQRRGPKGTTTSTSASATS